MNLPLNQIIAVADKELSSWVKQAQASQVPDLTLLGYVNGWKAAVAFTLSQALKASQLNTNMQLEATLAPIKKQLEIVKAAETPKDPIPAPEGLSPTLNGAHASEGAQSDPGDETDPVP